MSIQKSSIPTRSTVEASAARPQNTAGISIAPPAYQVDMADHETAQADDAPVQGVFGQPIQQSPAAIPNNTGLPDQLKTGIEQLSGYSMDDVQVHYNSQKPAMLLAHAYAQGTAIHIAPGQEKHLPHEAWHVVQQKQGRVKPTLQRKGGVNVNDDNGLEKEADVMGGKSSATKQELTSDRFERGAQKFMVQRKNTTSALAGNNTIQRRKDIPKGKYVQVNQGDGRWYGQVVRIEDNEGQFQYKIRLGGGSETDIHTVPEQYVEIHPMFGGPVEWKGQGDDGLDALLMKTGQLGELTVDEGGWEGIAKKLKKQILPVQQKADYPASFVEYICSIKVYNGRETTVESLSNKTDQVDPVAKFTLEFMEKNGQLAYIRKQPWFISGEYYIDILVNYYPDRSGFEDVLRFHKDTAGNNIFVNLIFDNTTDIVGTEWFEDVEDPSKDRAAWQDSLLPAGLLAELKRSRKALRYVEDPNADVKGGVSKGKNTYVSWVDDLVWHSTPNKYPRSVISADDLKSYYDKMFKNEKNIVMDVELMAIIATCSKTVLHKYLVIKQLKSQDINLANAKTIWNDVYNGKNGTFNNDVDLRAAESEIRVTKTYSEANAEDPNTLGANSKSIHETPVGLAGRRRANSMDESQEALEAARKASAGKTRSFIRTWVQIVKAK